jgi:asparagine synthase (glutamine-hydrolysing)
VSGLCGCLLADASAGAQTLERMTAALTRYNAPTSGAAAMPCGGLAAAGLPGTWDVWQDADIIAAVFGRPRLEEAAAAEMLAAPARWIAQAYRREGARLVERLGGAFCLAVTRGGGAGSEAFLATDRLGIMPMNYRVADGCLYFANSLDPIRAADGSTGAISAQALFDYFYFHVVPGPETIYEDCRRLQPGSCATFRDGRIVESRYWAPAFVENEAAAFERLREEFFRVLESSVAPHAGDEAVGCFLSGGTDSSTVSGMLGRAAGRAARTYSIGFDAQGYDEMEYARVAAKRYGTEQHEYYVTPSDVVDAMPRVAAYYDQPFGNASAVPAYYCARMAQQDGIGRMLAGDGGDELFGGNERYATQRVFALYERVPRVLRSGLIEPLLGKGTGTGPVGLLRKARSYVAQANVPMPARMQTYNLLDRIGVGSIFSKDFLARVDPGYPLALQADVYDNARASSLINRMLAFDLQFTIADSDIPKVNGMCDLAGVEVAYPLLADEVVDFSLRLPPDYKLKGNRLRWFFKEALRDFLPAEIISKKKHGFGLPFGPWLVSHAPLRELAESALASLKQRGIVRPEFIDELIRSHLSVHAGYYGTMVWIMVMLELWLQHHPTAVVS